MAATVNITSYHGSTGATSATVTAWRNKLADNDTADNNNRMPIPASGTQYAWVKHIALVAATSPASLIDTLQVYSVAALPTGVQMFAQDHAYTDPTTQQATPLTGWSNNYTGFTSGSPLSLAGSISNPSTGKINTNYCQLQLGIISTAAVGVMAAATITFSYLES